jgi:hypothetical protein
MPDPTAKASLGWCGCSCAGWGSFSAISPRPDSRAPPRAATRARIVTTARPA